MSRPWLSNAYKSSSNSRSRSPDSDSDKKKVRVDEFGRTVPVKSSRSRSRSKKRSRSRERSRERGGYNQRGFNRGGGEFRGRGRGFVHRGRGRGRGNKFDQDKDEKRNQSKSQEEFGGSKRRRKRSGSSSSSKSSRGSQDNVRPAASEKPKYKEARLFVANIVSNKVKKEQMVKHFAKYGEVADILIHPKNYAFVQFRRPEDARLAVEGENGATFQGSIMDVKMAIEGKQARNDRGRGRGRGDSYNDDQDRLGRRPGDSLEDFRPGRPRHEGRRPDMPPYPDDFRMRDPFYPPPLDPFMRGYPPDSWMPPDDPYRVDPYADPFRDPYPGRAPLPALPPPPALPLPNIECQVYIVNPGMRAYGEAIEDRIKELSIITAVTVMPAGRTAMDMMTDLTDRNGLFAIFVNAQNEIHRSLTLNILHGTPQEHRNMPIADAVTLIGRSFEQYVDKLREEKEKAAAAAAAPKPSTSSVGAGASRVFLPPNTEQSYLLNLLADNRALTVTELEDVIKYLKDRRSKLIDAENRPLASEEPNLAKQSKPAEASGPTTDEITSKILNIFSSAGGSLQGVLPPGSTSNSSDKVSATAESAQPASSSNSNLINFDNPNVQKALDNLIQSSPALMKTFGSVSSSQSAPPEPKPPSIDTVSRIVGRSSMLGYRANKMTPSMGDGGGGAPGPMRGGGAPGPMRGCGTPGPMNVGPMWGNNPAGPHGIPPFMGAQQFGPRGPSMSQPNLNPNLIAQGRAILAAAAGNLIASVSQNLIANANATRPRPPLPPPAKEQPKPPPPEES